MATQIATQRVALAVGIIILAVTTVAVISVVKQRGEAARHAEVTKIADAKLKQLESESAAKKSEAAKKKEAEQRAAAEKEAAAKKAAEQGSATLPGSTSQSELPQTGPAEAMALIPIALLAFAGASYYQSRRISL